MSLINDIKTYEFEIVEEEIDGIPVSDFAREEAIRLLEGLDISNYHVSSCGDGDIKIWIRTKFRQIRFCFDAEGNHYIY